MGPLFTPTGDPQNTMCLLGHPVAHSLSPKIHNTAFATLGLAYHYEVFDVEEKDLPAAIQTIRDLNIRGANLTMPLKEAVLPLLDELSENAKLAGSVNTIVNDNGKLIGHTTDGKGFMKALKAHDINLIGHSMCILGAGGAARSIICEAASAGLTHISVFKRNNKGFAETVEFAKRVNSTYQHCQVSVHDFADEEDYMSCLSAGNLLCNATNVGMHESFSLVPDYMLSQDLITVDIIYNPPTTKLLSDAKNKGAQIMNGKPMLLYQAAESFYLWTGQQMPVETVLNEVKELS